MKLFLGFFTCVFLFTLLACGGGGGAAQVSVVKPKVSIAWAPRSRAIDGPASAQSAVIKFFNASVTNNDVTMNVDRTGPASGSTVVYTGTEDIKVTPVLMTVNFYANLGGTGAIVGIASGSATVGADGTISTSITTLGTINSVNVVPGQSVIVGQTKTLDFEARDTQNNLVAVSPGSAIWSVMTGADKISFANGDATGLSFGSPTVKATVDGKVSSAVTVNVLAGTFTTIARWDAPESGLTWADSTILSGDGMTVTGRLLTSPNNYPGYWTPTTGWTAFSYPLNTNSCGITGTNHDASYSVGFINLLNNSVVTKRYYRWDKTGGATQIGPEVSQFFNRTWPGISVDGQTLFASHEDGSAKSFDMGTSTFSTIVDPFQLVCVSDNSQVLGGNKPTSQSPVGAIWTQAGGVETIAGTKNVDFVSDDANFAAGTDDNPAGFYWSRTGGITSHPNSSILCMSHDGKYLVYSDNVRREVYIWDAVGGERSIAPALKSASGDNQIEFYNFSKISISNDGKIVSGVYTKQLAGNVTGAYVFYATLSAPL